MADRVVVFVDYQNARMRLRESFYDPTTAPFTRGQFHPRKLAEVLVAVDAPARELKQVRVYRGFPSNKHDPTGYGACRRQIASWNLVPDIEIITRPLRYPRNYGTVPRSVSGPPEEKGIDVKLAIDVVTLAIRNEYDVGIIVSEDTDLRPALEAVLDLDVNAICEVASWDPPLQTARPLRLLDRPQSPLRVHLMDGQVRKQVEDTTDYTKSSSRALNR